ncbi:MAG: hypothetical protein ACXACW_10535 [Candidatus Hodarchaeales archaeon]
MERKFPNRNSRNRSAIHCTRILAGAGESLRFTSAAFVHQRRFLSSIIFHFFLEFFMNNSFDQPQSDSSDFEEMEIYRNELAAIREIEMIESETDHQFDLQQDGWIFNI